MDCFMSGWPIWGNNDTFCTVRQITIIPYNFCTNHLIMPCTSPAIQNTGFPYSSWKWKWSYSVMSDWVTPWTAAYQAPPSMEFPRQEYWSGLPFPSPGELPTPGIKPRSPTLQADSTIWATREAQMVRNSCQKLGLSQGPLDLQANILPTEQFWPPVCLICWHVIVCSNLLKSSEFLWCQL